MTNIRHIYVKDTLTHEVTRFTNSMEAARFIGMPYKEFHAHMNARFRFMYKLFDIWWEMA